ncbi:MAG: hypothetical protein ACO2PN_23330 [Pyrobaculum sp.]
MGWYCVYLLEAGERIAYASSSGRIEEKLRSHFRSYSSVASRGLRPDATYVLACTRSRSLALPWEAWLHRAYRPPYAARASAKRPRKPPHPSPRWYAPRAAVCMSKLAGSLQGWTCESVAVGKYLCVPWRTARGGEVFAVHHAPWHLPRSWI